jgi:Leucine-rich repeat (LRR) protein
LLLFKNEFNGTIPSSLGKLRLKELTLQNNALSGTVPNDLFENIDLTALRLDYNALEGTIGTSIGELKSLRDLRLNNNKFTGSLPITLWALSNLGTLIIVTLSIV